MLTRASKMSRKPPKPNKEIAVSWDKARARLIFEKMIPEKPGFYFVVIKKTGKVFYVGETKNLRERAKYIFKCYKNNPSPCCTNYKTAFGKFPKPENLCKKFFFKYGVTEGRMGRIEIEDYWKKHLGTNNKDFYQKKIKL